MYRASFLLALLFCMLNGGCEDSLSPSACMNAGPTGEPLARKAVDSVSSPLLLETTVPAANTEAYDAVVENRFFATKEQPLSTFSIDVDTASYSNVRRFLQHGTMPPTGAVRIEELINYFTYDYAPPSDERPFAVNAEVAGCPWHPQHRLVRIGLKGRVIERTQRPPSNLVFLIDVSGSMNSPDRLPLVQQGLALLIEQLTENDRVALVVYAGHSGMVLPSTTGDHKTEIRAALARLSAGGSTNGGQGIQLAYQTAVANFHQGGTNRVILCTDGDFNVGVTDQNQLIQLIQDRAKTGVFLSILGFGRGNLKDATMEKLADQGNGNYAYIDSLQEARKVLVEQMTGTLITVAKDVKIQIEFNPQHVAGYRLLGYENRVLANEDFKNDKKDAGEIGAGHTVTALYELVPAGRELPIAGANDTLKYQQPLIPTVAADSPELLTLKLRYKQPDGDVSTEMSTAILDKDAPFEAASADFRFATAVAAFGMVLRKSTNIGATDLAQVTQWASNAMGADRSGYRQEFLELVGRAQELSAPTGAIVGARF